MLGHMRIRRLSAPGASTVLHCHLVAPDGHTGMEEMDWRFPWASFPGPNKQPCSGQEPRWSVYTPALIFSFVSRS